MLSNDLKNGAKIVLKSGWKATIKDNMRGNTRMAEVQGVYTEIGSIYVHDIDYAIVEGEMVKIDLTEAQKKLEKLSTGMGF